MVQSALVLEGGALRCLFTAGVVDAMMKAGIDCSCVIGVSAGALCGVNYVSNQIGRTAEVNIRYVRDKRYLSARNWLRRRGFFNFDFLFGEVSETLVPLDYKTFDESEKRFIAVSTECKSGEVRYFEKGICPDIFKAVRSSCSIPLLEPMVQVEGEDCVDGGVAMAIPYQKAMDEGYEKIVVVLTRDIMYRKKALSPSIMRLYERIFKEYPQLLEAIRTAPDRYNQMTEEIRRLEADGKIFVIRPESPVMVGRMERDRKKLKALYREGRRIGKKRMRELKEYLEME